jgi:hypothetical protein
MSEHMSGTGEENSIPAEGVDGLIWHFISLPTVHADEYSEPQYNSDNSPVVAVIGRFSHKGEHVPDVPELLHLHNCFPFNFTASHFGFDTSVKPSKSEHLNVLA